jgi:uncharacterized protein YjbI with pentapeptide repeats
VGHKPQPGWKPWKPPPKKRDLWGLRGKTAWDWLSLLVVPVMLALFAGFFTTVQLFWQTAAESERQQALANQTAEIQRFLEKFRVQEESLQSYLDLMANLIIEHNLGAGDTEPDSAVEAIARAQTLTTLRKMNSQGKRTVGLFLADANLIQTSGETPPTISLSEADLSGANLRTADLHGIDLRSADLSGIILSNTNLVDANLEGANLEDANLEGAILRDANLVAADLRSADLTWASLRDANLTRANLRGTNLTQVDLDDADLLAANLSYADLNNTHGITNEELARQALTLKGATMPNGQKYEDWLKDREGRKEDEKNG